MQQYIVYVDSDGDVFWYIEKKGFHIRHRENGPAGEYSNGTKAWYKEGKRHREDGPAVERSENSSLPKKEYWLNDVQYSKEKFLELTSKSSADPCDGKEVVIEGKKYKLTLIDK